MTAHEPYVTSATVRDAGDELHIECRFSDGQKFAAVIVALVSAASFLWKFYVYEKKKTLFGWKWVEVFHSDYKKKALDYIEDRLHPVVEYYG